PYGVLPGKIKPFGYLPSLLVRRPLPPNFAVKLYRFVKPVPSVLTANTVPSFELPPPAVPYSVLPDKMKPTDGRFPSVLVLLLGFCVKLYKVVKPVPTVLTANTMPLPKLPQ